MGEILDFHAAWNKFYEKRDNRPSSFDYDRAKAVAEFFGARSYVITQNYIRDEENMFHINAGFLVAKREFPNSTSDSVYDDLGFQYRMSFSNAGSGGGTPIVKSDSKVMCPKSFVLVNPGVPCDYCEQIHLEE